VVAQAYIEPKEAVAYRVNGEAAPARPSRFEGATGGEREWPLRARVMPR
jgi:hypothetical protein